VPLQLLRNRKLRSNQQLRTLNHCNQLLRKLNHCKQRKPNQRRRKKQHHKNEVEAGWFTKFPWLVKVVLSKDEHGKELDFVLRCRECVVAGLHPSDNWVKGSTSVRPDSVSNHGKSKNHLKCVAHNAASFKRQANVEKKKETDPLETLDQFMDTTLMDAIIIRLKVMYNLLIKGRPLSDYSSELELHKHLKTPNVEIPAKYSLFQYESHRFAEDGTSALSGYVWLLQLADLKASEFLALEADESTCNSNFKQMILHLTGVKNGVTFTHFATLIQLDDGKAHTMATKILEFLGNIVNLRI